MKKKYKNKVIKKFRSKLEQTCWDLLKESGLEYYYEPFKIPLIERFEFNNDSWEKVGKEYKLQKRKVLGMTYTPDFTSLPTISNKLWIIETKGYPTDSFKLKWKLLKQWLVEKNYNWRLYMPTSKNEVIQSIEIIQKCEN